jgi:hypothetical protein
MYPAYKYGWKFLWLLPSYIIGVQIYTFVVALQRGIKPARLMMFVSSSSSSSYYIIMYLSLATLWEIVHLWISNPAGGSQIRLADFKSGWRKSNPAGGFQIRLADFKSG